MKGYIIVASDVDFKKSSLNIDIVKNIKSLDREVEALHLNNDWKVTEDVYVVQIEKM